MKFQDNQGFIQIQSTELLFLENELAGIGSRALAFIADFAIRAICITIMALLLAFSWKWNIPPLRVVLFVIIGLFVVAYNFFFEAGAGGKTPGKYLVGIRVLKNDGSRISVLDSAIRNVLRIVDSFPFGYVLGMVVVFFEKYNRRIGDMVADTVVIYDRTSHRNIRDFVEKRMLDAKPRSLTSIAGIENLTTDEREIVKQLYSRMGDLSPSEKDVILTKFWEKFTQKLQVQGIDDPEILVYELYKRI